MIEDIGRSTTSGDASDRSPCIERLNNPPSLLFRNSPVFSMAFLDANTATTTFWRID